MADKITVCGLPIDYMNVEQVMERFASFTGDDHLNLVSFITQAAIIRTVEMDRFPEYYSRLDLQIIGETEVLEAAGIDSGEVYEDVQENRFLDRILWQMIRRNMRIFLLHEDMEKASLLETYLRETYPDIQISGSCCDLAGEGVSEDRILNQINAVSPDVLISGLDGWRQDLFVLNNSAKIFSKIWISFGESGPIQKKVGYKQKFLDGKKQKRRFKQVVSGLHL